LTRAILAATLTLLVAPLALGQPTDETPCEALRNRFGSQKDWWKAAVQWTEVKPAPSAGELSWRAPLQVAKEVHGDSYYLVAHSSAQQCYVGVCGGTANTCRFFQPPPQ
jgi:hypothetical protein